ncbi:SCO1/SenC-domain-containing protein [Obelidium mucronatum]|nr:SCO1/SenC-domain-containing protein [Obelidium mucronatum]
MTHRLLTRPSFAQLQRVKPHLQRSLPCFINRSFTESATAKRQREQEDFSRFGWKSVTAFVASSALLYGYFSYEKAKMAEVKAAAAQRDQSVGKPVIGGPFSLVDYNGIPVTDMDYRGKFMLLYFGYTFCPDVCPEELEKMARVVENLKALRKDQTIVPIFISCDPKRDSIESIKEYLKDFHPDFIGLTGTHSQIKRAAKAYRLYFSAPPLALDDDDSDYLVDHSIFFYLVDPEGKYISHFGKQETSETVTEKIIDFLKTKGM